MSDAKEIREQAVRDAKINLILDAARKVFADKGFHQTRLEDIGTAAGFSKASLYNYYEDKESIFLSLANRDFSRMLGQLQAGLDPGLPFCACLERMIRTFLTFLGDHYAFFSTLHSFRAAAPAEGGPASGGHERLMCSFRESFSQSHRLVVELVSIARHRGEIVAGIDDEALAGYIGALVRGVLFDWKVRGSRGDVDADVRRLVEFVCRGAQVRSAPG